MSEILQQWEYQVLTSGGALKRTSDADLAELLAGWGEDGWELVSVTSIEGSNKVLMVAKRPLTRTTRRQRSMPG
jgi:hypothetical protein